VHKLPVLETAGRAYQFLLREAGTILRLSWLPLLVVTIIQYFVIRAQFSAIRSALEAGKVGAMTGISPMWQWQFLNFVVTIFGTAVVAVALHRVILLGDRKPGRFAHVAFGRVEMLFALLPIIVMIPIFIVSVLVFVLSAVVFPKSGYAFVLVAVVLLWAAAIFVIVRLALVFPLAVLEGRYNVSQSWSLTRGNFWRLVGLWLVALIPFAVVVAIITAATSPLPALGQGASKNVTGMFEQFESLLLIQTIVNYVWAIIGGALGVAVLSYSYKALSGIDPDAVWTPES